MRTKIITNRLTNKSKDYQPSEQVEFRKGLGQLNIFSQLVVENVTNTTNHYNLLSLTIKALDPVKLRAIFEALNNARVLTLALFNELS